MSVKVINLCKVFRKCQAHRMCNLSVYNPLSFNYIIIVISLLLYNM